MQDAPLPGSVGRLQVGTPVYESGLFSCDFIYTASVAHLGEDEIKSACMAVEREFTRLLKLNGFWVPGVEYKYEKPVMKQIEPGVIHIVCAVHTMFDLDLGASKQ